MPFVAAADGTRLHFTDWGEPGARPVLLVHGFGSSQTMWNNQVPYLVNAGLRCVTFDRRGHGRSDVPGRGYDLDTLAADIGAVARHLDLREAVLAGHSLGAAEAVRYLTAHAGSRWQICRSRSCSTFDTNAAADPRADLAAIDVPALVSSRPRCSTDQGREPDGPPMQGLR